MGATREFLARVALTVSQLAVLLEGIDGAYPRVVEGATFLPVEIAAAEEAVVIDGCIAASSPMAGISAAVDSPRTAYNLAFVVISDHNKRSACVGACRSGPLKQCIKLLQSQCSLSVLVAVCN